MPSPDLITVLLFGHPRTGVAAELTVADVPRDEADHFDAHAFAGDDDFEQILVGLRPQVIFTFGDVARFPRLLAAPLDIRRRWVHHDDPPASAALARQALEVYVDTATNNRFPEEPLVSVFTPTYRTGERLRRPFESLQDQTYRNWEWVVYDDSPDDETFRQLHDLANGDHRIRVFRGDRNCGVIGEVKRRLCGLARGTILVELDHDDELTDHCLADVVEAFNRYPEAGFVYTDCAEVFEDGEPAGYPEGWGFGFGSYRREHYRGRDLLVTNYPSVNAKTIRHIVGVPNHVRAWRRTAYEAMGGHGSEVHVADDYELLVRTFLSTRMVHVQRFGYIQYLRRDGGNTQRRRNGEIQRLVRLFHARYEPQIHERLLELAGDDFIWTAKGLDWSRPNPPDVPRANLVLQ